MAGRQSELFRYSGMTNPDITTGAKMFVSGLEMPEKIADDFRLKERQEAQDTRQAKQDALNTPGSSEWMAAKEAEKTLKMDVLAAEHDWNMKNNPVYRATIPGTEEYEAIRKNKTADQISIINAESAARLKEHAANPANRILMAKYAQELKDQNDQKTVAKDFFAMPKEDIIETKVTPEDVTAVKNQLEGNATTRAGAKYNAIYENLVKPKTELDVDANGEVVTYQANPTSTPEEAHAKALKESGLQDLLDSGTIKIDDNQLPKVGITSKKITYTPEQIAQKKLDIVTEAVNKGKISPIVGLEVANKITPVKSAKDIREDAKVAIDVEEFKAKKAADYWGKDKKSPDGGSGKALRSALEDMFKTYGEPDVLPSVLGRGDRADMEEKLAKLQIDNDATDAEMTSIMEKARGVYGNSLVGVNQNGFLRAVEEGLGKIPKKKSKEDTK